MMKYDPVGMSRHSLNTRLCAEEEAEKLEEEREVCSGWICERMARAQSRTLDCKERDKGLGSQEAWRQDAAKEPLREEWKWTKRKDLACEQERRRCHSYCCARWPQ